MQIPAGLLSNDNVNCLNRQVIFLLINKLLHTKEKYRSPSELFLVLNGCRRSVETQKKVALAERM